MKTEGMGKSEEGFVKEQAGEVRENHHSVGYLEENNHNTLRGKISLYERYWGQLSTTRREQEGREKTATLGKLKLISLGLEKSDARGNDMAERGRRRKGKFREVY